MNDHRAGVVGQEREDSLFRSKDASAACRSRQVARASLSLPQYLTIAAGPSALDGKAAGEGQERISASGAAVSGAGTATERVELAHDASGKASARSVAARRDRLFERIERLLHFVMATLYGGRFDP